MALSLPVLGLRLAKSAVLIGVSVILYRRRRRDAVAAMLALAFLLWTVSSAELAAGAAWPAVVDRFRFLLFALALLLFPDGRWTPGWTRPAALVVFGTFLLGIADATGLVAPGIYLPIAIGCIIAALGALRARFVGLEEGVQRQQLKWVTLGLVLGIGLILAARAGWWLSSGTAMPMGPQVAIEAMFQLGIMLVALGFLVSLLRFRLYDAETAISRSALYAALTLSLVGIFAACEALIELLGQRYLGSNIGSISGAVAAAVATVLLAPLHGRISDWAEQYFQRDLAQLKRELPELLRALSAGSSVKRLAAAVLPRIDQAVQATRLALCVDGRLAATHGIKPAMARKLLGDLQASDDIHHLEDDPFPLRLALRCPFGRIRGWLALGPRPDGSFYGRDELDALKEIIPPLQRTLFQVSEREQEAARQQRRQRAIEIRLAALEAAAARPS